MQNPAAILVGLGLLWFILAIAMLLFAIRLKEHRIDIGLNQPMMEGRSWAGIDNILNAANYDEIGRRRLPLLKVGITLEIAIFLIAGLLLTG